jgi:hypothetical protein
MSSNNFRILYSPTVYTLAGCSYLQILFSGETNNLRTGKFLNWKETFLCICQYRLLGLNLSEGLNKCMNKLPRQQVAQLEIEERTSRK